MSVMYALLVALTFCMRFYLSLQETWGKEEKPQGKSGCMAIIGDFHTRRY